MYLFAAGSEILRRITFMIKSGGRLFCGKTANRSPPKRRGGGATVMDSQCDFGRCVTDVLSMLNLRSDYFLDLAALFFNAKARWRG